MRLKDTDFLYATMRVRANEAKLLSSRTLSRMCDAKTPEEAAKLLSEAGYGEVSAKSFADVEGAIRSMREETIALVSEICKDFPSIARVFALKYDFHNIKTVIKSAISGRALERIMSDSGSVPKEKILDAYRKPENADLPERMKEALFEAKESAERTGNARFSDFILDRAYFDMMIAAASEVGSEFLCGYVSLLSDIANLRSAVRVARRGEGSELLGLALVPGGKIKKEKLLAFDFEGALFGTELSSVAEKAAEVAAARCGFIEFERELDNATIRYMQSAKYVAFDEKPIIAYVAAREAEAMAVRIIMAGKFEGLSADEIRSRLRVSYV